MKYTDEQLRVLVSQSLSVAEVIRKLGYKCLHGGTHSHISRRIKSAGIDISHFLGKARQRGIISPKRLKWQSVLVKSRSGNKEHVPVLRRAMIQSGIEHVCGSCGLKPEWNGKSLVLQISHKDGDSLNNEKENLHFQCPNCHSQTDDFGGRSAGKKSFKALVGKLDIPTAF